MGVTTAPVSRKEGAFDFDLFTIGAGSGGVAGSRRAAAYGARVGIAEEIRVGGTCVLRGCVPKKLLVYAAHFADDLADAAGFGWTIGPSQHDWPRLIAAKDHELDRLNAIYRKLLADSGVQLFNGRARLLDPHTVEILDSSGGSRQVTAERILIATGGHPVVPAIPGIEHAITSNEALDLPQRPNRAIIVGGGYIAVEFAGIFRGLGADVVQLVRSDRLLAGFDHDLGQGLADELRHRGIDLRLSTQVTRIDRDGDSFRVMNSVGETVTGDCVLYATGRRPNIKGLGLDLVGIKTTATGAIPVDEWSETCVPGIYAVGDVTDRLNLTPVAIAEARALAETLFNANPTRFEHKNVASAVFSNPPLASVGLDEAAARAAYPHIDIYRARFRPMKHTLTGREERVMMKLVVDRDTDLVLGCHMLGSDAPEIIQGLAIALKCGATKRQFDQTVGIHPTVAEEFVTMREPVPPPSGGAE